ncbi:hypothetical protein [Bacillus paranthracis]
MNKDTSSLKLGNEKYGSLKVEEAFLKALEAFFNNKQAKRSSG